MEKSTPYKDNVLTFRSSSKPAGGEEEITDEEKCDLLLQCVVTLKIQLDQLRSLTHLHTAQFEARQSAEERPYSIDAETGTRKYPGQGGDKVYQ